MMTKLLGLSSERMAAEVITEIKKGHFTNDLQRKIRSLRLQFIGAHIYGCSYAPVFLNLIRLANPLLKCISVCNPPDLRAVAHRLRTSVLEHSRVTLVC